MVVALASDLSQEWLGRLERLLGDKAMLLPVTADTAPDLAHGLAVSILIANAEPLVAERIVAYQRVMAVAPDAVLICIASAPTREQLRRERLLTPDHWVEPAIGTFELEDVVRLALEKVALVGARLPAPPTVVEALQTPPPPDRTNGEEGVLRRLLAAMAGNADPERLLAAYVEGACHLVRCAGHCFLWREEGREALTVKSAMGLSPQVATHARLNPGDALCTWYRSNCRALTRQELSRWPDTALAALIAQELEVFRGQVAIPLTIAGRLDGLLILGEKVVGEQYTHAELETLFVLTGYVGLHLENIRLQAHVAHARAYMERSLSSMRCGLITLDHQGRIAVCNPYAARLLGRTPEQLEGADLRTLPSPLGDRLYAASRSTEATTVGESVQLANRETHLRLTTSTLLDATGEAVGSVMLLEDTTAPTEEAARASRQDTINVLTRIIGRLAHEVRTPLTAIKTYAQLMDAPDDHEEMVRFWRETVSPELDRLDQLITEQVRLVEQPPPNFQLVSVDKLLEEAITNVSHNGTRQPLLKVVPPVPQVVADPGPTRDAFSYLLRYLCEHGKDTVGIQLDTSAKGPAPRVRVRMRTLVNGGQLDPTTVLDPVAALQSEQGDLGPAIGRQLVDKMGGSVEARRTDDYFEFRVLFPAGPPETAPTGRGDADG